MEPSSASRPSGDKRGFDRSRRQHTGLKRSNDGSSKTEVSGLPFQAQGEEAPQQLNDSAGNDSLILEQAERDAQDGNLHQALLNYSKALDMNPGEIRALLGIAKICQRNGHHDRASDFYRAAVTVEPQCIRHRFSLAAALHEDKQVAAAVQSILDARQSFPDDAAVRVLSESILNAACEFQHVDPDQFKASAHTLLKHQSHPEQLNALRQVPLESLHSDSSKEDHCRYRETVAHLGRQLTPTHPTQHNHPYPQQTRSAKQLRIGFVSGDLKQHVVTRFLLPLFKGLKAKDVDVFAYSTCDEYDSISEELANLSTAFRRIPSSKVSLQRALDDIRHDEIDVLFDLSGHTKDNRLDLFAHRAAPIQASWLGYPASTGIPAMDYLLTDEPSQGIASQDFCTETLIAKSGPFLCIDGWLEREIDPVLPEERHGYITLGVMNHTRKITPEAIETWSEILRQHPQAKLLIGRSDLKHACIAENIRNAFTGHGIKAEQLRLITNASPWLDVFNEIDICLDSFPYTGTTTTIDSLWMGVPVITLSGTAIHQRASAAILHHLGQDEWITETTNEYCAATTRLMNNRLKRQQARQTLRAQLIRSPLSDYQSFAVDFLSAVQTMRSLQQTKHSQEPNH